MLRYRTEQQDHARSIGCAMPLGRQIAGWSAGLMMLFSANVTQAWQDASPEFKAGPEAIERVTADIEYLASDELGGRAPGTPGMELAVEYIVKAYEEAGLQKLDNDSYFQELEVGGERKLIADSGMIEVESEDGKVKFSDSDFTPLLSRRNIEVEAELVFAGYAISADEHNYDDFSDIDVDGKVAVIIRREPQQKDQDSVFDGEALSEHAFINNKVSLLRRRGAAGIILVNDSVTIETDGEDTLAEVDQFGRTSSRVPMMHCKRSKINELLADNPLVDPEGNKLTDLDQVEKYIDEKLEPLSQPMEGVTVTLGAEFELKRITTVNIVGVIEGEGPFADETIVIGGHYDHLGVGKFGSRARDRLGEVHNGADDNATGTAGVIELARRFNARDKKPGRRLVFICFTAEEMGLLGAQHYVENPLFPLEKTVAMINFDMIGWLRNDELTCYNWNTSPQWEGALESANSEFDLTLNKPVNAFGGSDHLPFNNKEIPNLFIHTGLTDTYHTPDDDFDTIDCKGATRVIDYTEALIDGVASMSSTPTYGAPKEFVLGVSVAIEESSVKIESVAEDSIASKSGLMAGDVIMMIGEEEITARRHITRAIRRYKGETAMFKLKRDDAEVNLNILLSNEDRPPVIAGEEEEEKEKK